MRRKLRVPFLGDAALQDNPFASLEKNVIQEVSWPEYPYLPQVSVKIAYTSQSILLEYEVKEQDLIAVYKKSNDPVYKDSCVEFFVSFDGEHYYNFEFNSLGTALVGYGTSDKGKRERLPAALIETIKTKAWIADHPEGQEQHWRLQLEIPFALFYQESIDNLTGVKASANFYKCGDDLPLAHFVSWNKIDAESPNFHLPAYFGMIEFV